MLSRFLLPSRLSSLLAFGEVFLLNHVWDAILRRCVQGKDVTGRRDHPTLGTLLSDAVCPHQIGQLLTPKACVTYNYVRIESGDWNS
ncbi:hypothetical protein GGR58DRAFT_491797 [Xylaria digitata]|nr:hypothetical protein GGR58DRAFT_491797 [Xylaria digitata]